MSTNVFLATDDETQGAVVRKVLLREGLDCPVTNVVRVELAPQLLPRSPADLIVVVLPEDYESSLTVLDWLEKLPRTNGERVLAIGPAADPKMVLRALRGAVDDYLDQTDLEAELMAALGRWRATLVPAGGGRQGDRRAGTQRRQRLQHPGRQPGHRPGQAAPDRRAHRPQARDRRPGRPARPQADLYPGRPLSEHRADGPHALRALAGAARQRSAPAGAPRHYDDIARVTPEGVHQALALAKSSFPYVLVDLDHSFRPEQVEVLREADVVLLVLRLDFASLRNARRALEHIERLGIDRDRIRLVVNRYGQPKEVPFSKAEEALGMKIFHYVPDDPKSINRANNNGVPVVLGVAPRRRLAKRHQAGRGRQRPPYQEPRITGLTHDESLTNRSQWTRRPRAFERGAVPHDQAAVAPAAHHRDGPLDDRHDERGRAARWRSAARPRS